MSRFDLKQAIEKYEFVPLEQVFNANLLFKQKITESQL